MVIVEGFGAKGKTSLLGGPALMNPYSGSEEEQRVAANWKSTDGTVASSVEFSTRAGPMYTVVFTYKVDGSWLGGTFTTRTPYQVGDTVVVQYDPSNPERNDLVEREKRRNWFYVAFFILLGILVIYLALQPKAK